MIGDTDDRMPLAGIPDQAMVFSLSSLRDFRLT